MPEDDGKLTAWVRRLMHEGFEITVVIRDDACPSPLPFRFVEVNSPGPGPGPAPERGGKRRRLVTHARGGAEASAAGAAHLQVQGFGGHDDYDDEMNEYYDTANATAAAAGGYTQQWQQRAQQRR